MNDNTAPTVEENLDQHMNNEVETLKAQSETLKEELNRQKETYLRTAADFDNFRKRVAQDAERRAVAQKEAFIRELLPVIDNLERALDIATTASAEQLHQGVRMTLHQLLQLLQQQGIEPEDSTGLRFDPHLHEAVALRHDPSKPDHTILETVQRGYRRGQEVFRPAKSVVNSWAE